MGKIGEEESKLQKKKQKKLNIPRKKELLGWNKSLSHTSYGIFLGAIIYVDDKKCFWFWIPYIYIYIYTETERDRERAQRQT